MVPVGRLTMVRTFAKSELIRAMSFVAIPGLIGPMLGPIAGGLIVGYLHWRVIFFVNLPIGLVGLYLVYRHLPDYREKKTHPLDIIGLILFGSGIALLSYVLEVFGEHTLERCARFSGCWRFPLALLAGYGLHAAQRPSSLCCGLTLFRIRTFRAVSQRQLFHAPGHRRNPVSVSAALPGRAGLYADSVRPADDAAGDRRHELENDHAGILRRFGYRSGADFQHGDSRPADFALCDDRHGHAGLAHRGWSFLLSDSSPRCNIRA